MCHCLGHLKELDFSDAFWVFGIYRHFPAFKKLEWPRNGRGSSPGFSQASNANFCADPRYSGLPRSPASLASVIEAWKTMPHEGPVFASGSEDIRNSNVKAQALKATADVESFKAFLKPIDSMECYRDSFTHLLESSWCIAFETRGMSIPSQCHSMSTHQNDPRVLGRSRPQGSLVAPSELGQKLHGHRSSLRIHSRHRTVAAVAQHAWQHEIRTFRKAKEIANSLNLQVDGFSAFTELMSQIKCQLHACNALPRKSRMLFAA